MQKIYPINYIRFLIMAFTILVSCLLRGQNAYSQTAPQYKAPQDTVTLKRNPFESLTTYDTTTVAMKLDSRLIGAGVKAAEKLSDTTKFDNKKGIALEQLFSDDDLEYVAKLGVNGVVALFEIINKHLPKNESILFRTDQIEKITKENNPLVLKNLRAFVSDKPATIRDNQPQWKENVYQAYMARDYGTKLNNTITILTATREIRETPELKIIDYNGNEISLSNISARKQSLFKSKRAAEKAAVDEFLEHTYPNAKISKENANENYRRALFVLIRLQESDINSHQKSKEFIKELANDLKKGKQSNTYNSLKGSRFFDANVPDNIGPVLLTEDHVINADEISQNPDAKAMEIMILTSLHYGERDAVKLLNQLVNGKGSIPAQQTGDFTPKRLGELTFHGVEKLKSLGFKADKTQNVSSADLVLVAVSSPDVPVKIRQNAFLNIQEVGASIINQYTVIENTEQTVNTILFDPRISFGTRHTEYRAAFDPVDYVPEFNNGIKVGQKGSRITQNGVELRLESDLYFSNARKIALKGVKPIIYPDFGLIAGIGTRSVGYDNNTTIGEHGPVPQFKSTYIDWGTHLGINVGPVGFGLDATVLSTPANSDPDKRFFDLSQGMTYYRYSLLIHVLNFGFGEVKQGKGYNLIVDAEFAAETNNEGPGNITHTQGSDAQVGSSQWDMDYARAHPHGIYDATVADEMILNGEVKASYAASNYAQLHVGVQKSNFLLKASLGFYNINTIAGDKFYSRLFENTFSGNVFGGIGLTYNFSSGTKTTNHYKKESYQTTNGQESPHKVDESSSEQSSPFGPRNHAIFTNKKSRIKPAEVNTTTSSTTSTKTN